MRTGIEEIGIFLSGNFNFYLTHFGSSSGAIFQDLYTAAPVKTGMTQSPSGQSVDQPGVGGVAELLLLCGMTLASFQGQTSEEADRKWCAYSCDAEVITRCIYRALLGN